MHEPIPTLSDVGFLFCLPSYPVARGLWYSRRLDIGGILDVMVLGVIREGLKTVRSVDQLQGLYP